MKRKIIALAVLVTFVAFTALMVAEYKQESTPVFKNADTFTTAVNTERAIRDLKPVKNSQELEAMAQGKCNDMVKRNYAAHQDPDGKFVWDSAPKGIKYGENLAGGYYSSYETMQKWVASPEHLVNIVDPVFNQVGHATCYNGTQFINVQVFSS